jgi:transposase
MNQIDYIKELKDEKGLSFREISKTTGLARQTVRKWYYSKKFPKYERKRKASPKKDQILPYIRFWIDEDIKEIKKRKRKSIRPASTMWQQLKDMGIQVAKSTVRHVVSTQKPKETFIALEYEPGEDMQVDWGELMINFKNSKSAKVYIFVATLPYSNTRFAYPYMKNDWFGFVNGHIRAFDFFKGLPMQITYDNLTSAIKKVLSGINRIEQDRMLYFKNFYNIETNYCGVGKGNEKGSVENGVGFFKRRFLGGHIQFDDFDHLRQHLLTSSLQLLNTQHYLKKSQTIEQLFQKEQEKFRPLPEQSYDSSLWLNLKSNNLSQISYDGVKYSVLSTFSQRELSVKISDEEITVYNNKNELIAEHKRVHKALQKEVFDFRHYLSTLLEKPRALDKAKCIKQSGFPLVFWDYLKGLNRHQSNGNREMVRILFLEKKYGLKNLWFAMEWGLNHNSFSYDVIKLTLSELDKKVIPIETVKKPYPKMDDFNFDISKYDKLLGGNG